MKRLTYVWRYYIWPVLIGLDPNSTDGHLLRIRKLKEDEAIHGPS